MRTINIIISALADAVLEAKGLDSNNNHGKDGSAAGSSENKHIPIDHIQEEE